MGESTFFPYSGTGGTPTREDTTPGTQTFTGDDIFLQSGTLRNNNTQLRLTLNSGATVDVDISELVSPEITGLTFNESNRQLTINTGDGLSYSVSIPDEVAELTAYRTAAAQDIIDAGLQQRVDGIFFVSTTAQRALNPPVGEFGLYSDYNGTPVLEHTQPMVARGIRGVGSGFPIPDSSEGEILYDDWEIVSDSIDAVEFVGQSLTADQQATARRNIGAQQTIDGVFLVSTAAQRALDPPVGELAFFANVGGVPTRESTQGLLVRGVSGFGDPTYEFNDDDESQLWFEVEFAGGGGGGGTAIFATSDAWESQNGLTLQLDEYVSTDEDYVPVRADAELRAAGYEAGDSFFITERDIEYQVIITSENFALQYVISNRDTIAELSGGQGVLDDISDNTTNIATNTADIESVVQHNHEQDARIAALENQDFTTTISSFTESTTLSNFFTSGTVINKGNAGSNLYQAWTVTREGHELIGYLQLTDTERDSFRNEFSLIQGSSSNIYIPANPDAPHTIGIKAFPAADFNDLSSSTQVMLGQISSMRYGGDVGSETMFEIRWELLNYSDAIDTGLGTVDSGEIYGAAGDKRYAFLAPTIYTTPVWEFREATVSRTEIISTGTSVSINNTVVDSPNFLDNDDADGIHIEVTNNNEIKFNLNHLPGAAHSSSFTYRSGDSVTFNGTEYISLTTQTGVGPIDGGSSNNVFHGVGAVPSGDIGTGDGQFLWRIAKAGIIIGTYNPTTEVSTDEVTAESLHFNTDHFTLTPNLTTGDEVIALNPDAIGSGLVKSVTNTNAPNSWNSATGALNVTSNTGAEVTADSIEGVASQVADDTWGIGQIGNLTEELAGKENAITYSPNAPSSPSVGDLWIDTGDGSQFRYASGASSSNHWIQVAGQGENSTSAIASQIGDFILTANGSGSAQTLDFQTGGVVIARLTKTGQWTTLNEQTDNDGTAL